MINKQPTFSPNWYQKEPGDIVQQLATNLTTGLASAEIPGRITQHGLNELIEQGRKSPWRLLWEQFSSTMVLILLAAALVSAFLGKATETAAISAIVLLFTILGFVQEYRAEQAMAALKKLAVPTVRVRRDGRLVEQSARDLVPGDILLLEAGNLVPADVRFVESVNLRIQESALTGESEPVEKETTALNGELPLGDRRNMGYMGTVVTYGRGTAIVVETGMKTELGKIAALIQTVEDEVTPLQQRLDQVGKQLAVFGIVVAALVLVIGVLRGEPVSDMFLTAVSVAVAVVPEGLPAVVTVTLALGSQRMLRRKALIRKLPAVETLGSVTTICSDKTGTLTENRMTVTVIDVAGHYLELTGTARHPAPALQPAGYSHLLTNQPPLIGLTLVSGALCNDASLLPDPQTGRYVAVGDPTEGALLVAAAQAGLNRGDLEQHFPRLAEWPFDSDRKRMTTVHGVPAGTPPLLPNLALNTGPFLAITKGAVDGLLDIATKIWVDEQPETLDDHWRQRIQAANEQMAQKGMRVLGLGLQWLNELPTKVEQTLERDLILVGLVGMIDPPRPEVKQAVHVAKAAGIRPIMITGDHPLTARFIAQELGISDTGRVKTGQELNHITPAELEKVVGEVSIYARVSPEHKLQIVEMLQKQGQVVAMTGDGVNDSPALKKANIGIAMGITGTDVSKEASEMVLLDDNFTTIVAAAEEGRVIYDNIRRFVKFSIAGNIGKVFVMLLAPLFGINVALLPLQLLWLNLLTDGLLGLGLGVEAAEKNTMKRPPRRPNESLFSDGLGFHLVWVGLLIGVVALGVGRWFYDPAGQSWQTMMFTTLAFLQIGQALASRSSDESLFQLGFRSNPTIWGLAGVTILLQLAAIYVPALDQFFGVVPLSLNELLICAALGSLAFVAIEIEKWLKRK